MYRRPGRGRLLLLAFVILSILIITLSFQEEDEGPLAKAHDVAAAIVAPVQRGVTVVVRPVRNFFSSIGELGSLRSENEKLEDEAAEAESRVQAAEDLEEEVARLRDALRLDEPWFTMDAIDAEVISNQANNWKWAVTIDKGLEDGIRPNMAVVDPTTAALVGKTIDVTADTASVLLLIDPQGSARAHSKSAEGSGNVTGNGADEDLSLELIGPESKIKVDDTVVTSPFNEGIFPPGIPIGKISYVGDDQAGVEKIIEVEPFVEFKDLQFVKVLLESGPKLQAKGGKDR